MAFVCVFCEEQPCYFSYLCDNCRALKHTKLLYKERFNEVIKNVLLRTRQDLQQHKIKDEIKKDIEEKQIILKSQGQK